MLLFCIIFVLVVHWVLMVRFWFCFRVVILRFTLFFHTLLVFPFLPLILWVCVHVVGVVFCGGVRMRKYLTSLFWFFPRWQRFSRALIAHARVVPGAFRVGFSLGLLVHSVQGSLVVILSRSLCGGSGSVFSLGFFTIFSSSCFGLHPSALALAI